MKEVFLVGLTTLAREGEWAALLDLMHDLRQIQVRALPTHQPRCRSHVCRALARWLMLVVALLCRVPAQLRPDEGLARACNYAISCCVRDRQWSKVSRLA